MAYEKQNFTDGSVLTATQLNHMEDGIKAAHDSMDGSASVLMVGLSCESTQPGYVGVADHSGSEIAERIQGGGVAYLRGGEDWGFTIPLAVDGTSLATANYVSDEGIAYRFDVLSDSRVFMFEFDYVADAKKYADGLITGTIIPATVE